MAQKTLIRHGSRAGYDAELATGNICERCRAAKRVYGRQYTKAGKAKGLKYGFHEVIDHLDAQTGNAGKSPRTRLPRTAVHVPSSDSQADVPAQDPPDATQTDATQTDGPTLGDRLSERIRGLVIGGNADYPEYVTEQDTGYVHEIEDTDSMGPEWEPAEESEYIINAAGLKTIQENMATYLSVIGITVEMIDPYCGPILAQNFDNMVQKWSKVVAHYPKAAELFMDGKGGVIFTWIGALQATWPVLYAIYQHHLAKTVAVAPNGQIYNRKQQPNPNGQFPDPLQPEFQYSAT